MDQVDNINAVDTDKEKKQAKRKKIHRRVISVLILIIIIGILLLTLYSCNSNVKEKVNQTLNIETNAGEIQDKTQDKDEIQKKLNEQVAENSICISMNTNLVFQDGTAEGEMDILNDETNRYLMVVEIVRKDTNETIYKTDAIPVGKEIVNDKLDTVLPKGQYKCVAYFNAYDANTFTFMGKAGAEVTVTVVS